MKERIQPIIILAHEKGLITGEMFHCAIEDIERIERRLKHLEEEVYNEIQDASIVLLSMFSTVRLKLKNIIEGETLARLKKMKRNKHTRYSSEYLFEIDEDEDYE